MRAALLLALLAIAPIVRAQDPLIREFGGPGGLGQNVEFMTTAVFLDDVSSVFPNGINFYGGVYDALMFSAAGNITFVRPVGGFEGGWTAWPTLGIFHGHGSFNPATGRLQWDIQPHIDDVRPGQLAITWYLIGTEIDRELQLNTYQAILTNRGGGDFDVEYRYARCEWAEVRLGLLPDTAIMGFSSGDPEAIRHFDRPAADAIGEPRDYTWSGSGTDDMLRLCELSNTLDGDRVTPGLFRYRFRDGELRGCGNGIVEDDEQCDAGWHRPRDGCTPDCRIAPDVDGDHAYELPAGPEPPDPFFDYDRCPDRDDPACDADRDDDGIPDRLDNCDADFNPDQRNYDADINGDACDRDADADNVEDFDETGQPVDNCRFRYNPGPDHDGDGNIDIDEHYTQLDFDGDGQGDICDPDDDGDGVLDCGT
ncbi:MAG: nidogen-like domain-containing protein, partial [bacterium]